MLLQPQPGFLEISDFTLLKGKLPGVNDVGGVNGEQGIAIQLVERGFAAANPAWPVRESRLQRCSSVSPAG